MIQEHFVSDKEYLIRVINPKTKHREYLAFGKGPNDILFEGPKDSHIFSNTTKEKVENSKAFKLAQEKGLNPVVIDKDEIEKNEFCTGGEFAKMAPRKNILIQRKPYYKKLTKQQKHKYTRKHLKDGDVNLSSENKVNENSILNNKNKGEIKEMVKNKTRKEYNRLREALLVSPSGQSTGNTLTEHEYYKTSTSEYADIPHYEVDFNNTGLDSDDGILYIDPETDGTEITIRKIDEDGSVKEYYLDLTFPTPSLSSNDPAYTGFTESRKRVLVNRKALAEKRNRKLRESDLFNVDEKFPIYLDTDGMQIIENAPRDLIPTYQTANGGYEKWNYFVWLEDTDPVNDGTKPTQKHIVFFIKNPEGLEDLRKYSDHLEIADFLTRKLYESKKRPSKKYMKEGEPRLVNNFKNSLGNYLTSHQVELSKARTTDDLIVLVSGALGLGNDTYVNKILDDIEHSSFARGQYELYNILLKGAGDGVIR